MPDAIIVILDNSNYSINGDYQPTRWLAQIEAAGLLIQTKMEQSSQVAMGIALSAGKQVDIICTPSCDLTKVTSFLYGIKQTGLQKLANALQTAALALKHRANPALQQRIICFIASTITENIEELKIICKKLKKNGIALDLIGIGDLSEGQQEKLRLMNQTVKAQASSSELVVVPPAGNISDLLFSCSILGGNGSGAVMMTNEIDDPELRLALQLSLQQEQQRLALLAAAQRHNQPNPAIQEQQDLEQRALQLSLQEEQRKNQKKEEKKDEKDEKKE